MAPYCKSDLLYKTALQDRSRTVWRGMIKVDRNAQRTDAYQRNDNLMLSRDARADSIPGLEIEADDVRCTHGSTCGRVDDQQVVLRDDPRLHAPRSGADDRRRVLPAGVRPDHDRKRPRRAGRGDRPASERHQGIRRGVTVLEFVANIVRFVGLVMTLVGLWHSAGGMRVVVSGRIDERRKSASSLRRGLPLLAVGLLLLFGGTWLATWA